jgi:hypothetical protein
LFKKLSSVWGSHRKKRRITCPARSHKHGAGAGFTRLHIRRNALPPDPGLRVRRDALPRDPGVHVRSNLLNSRLASGRFGLNN